MEPLGFILDNMPLRYQKRVNLGKGRGLNLSKSGVSYSKRTKVGSVGSRGFSIKTGIPGLTFRKSWGKSGSGLLILMIIGGAVLSWWVFYNLARLIVFLCGWTYEFIQGKYKSLRKSDN
ncbi:DUF4236 domain-containing protein [Fulvivirga imtechensis]|uniref:DUF4236 domain-containing protein n=1 Tax=Fulvivirga imtechensis TaxID=881893 RepID=UPI0005916E8D